MKNQIIKDKLKAIFVIGFIIILLFMVSVSIVSGTFTKTQRNTNKISGGIPEGPVENQAIIKFVEGSDEEQRLAYIKSFGGKVVEEINGLDTYVINVPDSIDETNLPASEVIENSELDYYVAAMQEGNDEGQGNVIPDDTYFPDQWALKVINVTEIWAKTAYSETVKVAVIDSGVCLGHPDLEGRILPGYDFIENDTEPQDEMGHGCGVAGIIAANTNNNMGIAGISPNAMILPIRVLDKNGVGTYSGLAAAIVWAVDNGADIINLSLGGINRSDIMSEAVEYAFSSDVDIIAAAGNTGDDRVLYPAVYPEVISVGSVDEPFSDVYVTLEISSFSSKNVKIDAWAPGNEVWTTDINDNEYKEASGTSYAAAQFTGFVTLFGKNFSNISSEQTRTIFNNFDRVAESQLITSEGDDGTTSTGTDDGTITAQADYTYTTVLNGVSIPATSGTSGVEQHCAINDEKSMSYCDAADTHYQRGNVPAGLQNGMAFDSSCQDPVNYCWHGSKPSCYDGFYCYASPTWAGCDPLPLGTCAMVGGTIATNEEIYYIAMRWSSSTFAKQKRIYVKNNAKNKCAVAVALEWGPSASTGKVAGFSPELSNVLQNAAGSDNHSFGWFNDQNLTPGPIDCSLVSQSTPCGTPPSSGTWSITSSCDITGTVSAPNVNISVSNGATLTVYGTLDFDPVNYKLTVSSDSKVIVDPNGKIY